VVTVLVASAATYRLEYYQPLSKQGFFGNSLSLGMDHTASTVSRSAS
jgi:hypothetical protein